MTSVRGSCVTSGDSVGSSSRLKTRNMQVDGSARAPKTRHTGADSRRSRKRCTVKNTLVTSLKEEGGDNDRQQSISTTLKIQKYFGKIIKGEGNIHLLWSDTRTNSKHSCARLQKMQGESKGF